MDELENLSVDQLAGIVADLKAQKIAATKPGSELLGRLDTAYEARQPDLSPSMSDYAKEFASGAGEAAYNLPGQAIQLGKAAIPYAKYLIPVYGQYQAGKDLGLALKRAEAERAAAEQTPSEYYTPLAKKATEIGVRGGAQIAGALGGGALGGLAGIETGPGAVVTALGGAGAGASAMDLAAKQALEYLGISEPTSGLEKAREAGAAFALGGIGETVPVAAKIIKAIPKPSSSLISALRGNEEVMKEMVTKEMLSRMTPDEVAKVEAVQTFPTWSKSPTGAPLTLAEVTGSPSIAQYQQQLINDASTGKALIDAMKSRRQAVESGVSEIGIPTQTGEMSMALRDAAAQAEKQKAARMGSLAESLGVTPEVQGLTKLEKGEALINSIQKRAEEAYKPVKEAWAKVPKDTKLDIAPQLDEIVKTEQGYGDLTKKQISGLGNDLIKKANDLLYKNDGIVSVNEYQDLLGTANYILRESKQPIGQVERGLISRLRRSLLDIEPVGINAASEDLMNAHRATKEYRQTYSQGVVGALIETRGAELVKKASRAVQEALSSPENAREVVSKFGRNSEEALTLRADLMTQLNAAKNPTEFIARNKDLFNIFEGDLSRVQAYAKAKQTGTGLERFSNVVDATLPSKIFADAQTAKQFSQQFGKTEIGLMARRKFADKLMSERGNLVENLGRQKTIAQHILQDDYDKFATLVSEVEQLKVPGKLEALATGKQSATSTRATAFLKLMQDRASLQFLANKGSQLGAGLGAIKGGWAGAIGGAYGGEKVSQASINAINSMNRLASEIAANPTMLKMATEASTAENVAALSHFADTIGITTKDISRGVTGLGLASHAYQDQDLDSMSVEQLKNHVNELRKQVGQSTPANTSVQSNEEQLSPTLQFRKPGKLDVSYLAEQQSHVDPFLVKAVIHAESAGNAKARSKKGAQGLMQIMPETAKELGIDPTDPEQNVEGGSRYLAKLLDNYNGDEELALAAYNWGLGNVNRGLSKLEKADLEPTWDNLKDYVRVPSETQKYVAKVLTTRNRLEA